MSEEPLGSINPYLGVPANKVPLRLPAVAWKILLLTEGRSRNTPPGNLSPCAHRTPLQEGQDRHFTLVLSHSFIQPDTLSFLLSLLYHYYCYFSSDTRFLSHFSSFLWNHPIPSNSLSLSAGQETCSTMTADECAAFICEFQGDSLQQTQER